MGFKTLVFATLLVTLVIYKSLDEFDEILIGEVENKNIKSVDTL